MAASASFKPFRNLKSLLEKERVRLRSERISPCRRPAPEPADHQELFREAMKDVVPLVGRNRRVARAPHHLPAAPPPGGRLRSEEASVRRELMELLENGTGFDWSLTDEYLEHSGRCVDPRLARQLHEGRFSVQACIDLHGLSLKEAKTAVDRFLLEAVQTRKNAVLIVHGRGLSSPGEPVLKAGLVKWLRSAPWRRWIAAYATARSCDGGPGATYVLLRPTPGGPKKGRRAPGSPRAGPG